MRSLDRSFAWRKDAADRYRAISERLDDGRVLVTGCPICGQPDRALFTEVCGFAFVQCDECGHIYMASPPDQVTVRDLYSQDEDARAAQARVYVDNGLFLRRVEQIARPKVEHVRSIVAPGGKWIDVGCATGEILAAARDAGWEPLGLETDPTEIDFARSRGLNVLQEYVTDRNASRWLADASVLSLLNMLEHMVRPAELLAEMVEPLGSGAHVVIEVPRHPSISSLSNMLFPKVACRHAYAPEHLHVFSEDAMERMLARADLEPMSIWTFGQDFQELISSASLMAGVAESPFLSSIFDLTPCVQQAIDDADFSDDMFVVSRKR